MIDLKNTIKNFSEHTITDSKFGVGVARLGHLLNSKHIGINVATLPPGTQTSDPHAESGEEEFGYVISGNPILWVDGEAVQLKPGHAFGFTAGTGICHTVINDQADPAVIVSIGERTKPLNKWIAPLNPERRIASPTEWWNDWPVRSFGPHSGRPNSNGPLILANDIKNLVHAPSIARAASFSYTGSTETFGDGVRLSDHLSLKMLGIWHESLAPHKRSSWPHAHSQDDEFCFVLKGHPTIWIHGHTINAKPGDLIYFEAGSGLGHVVINNTNEAIEYLGFGMSPEAFPDDKLFYPLHPNRNEECKSKNFLWEDRPAVELLGPHLGMPDLE